MYMYICIYVYIYICIYVCINCYIRLPDMINTVITVSGPLTIHRHWSLRKHLYVKVIYIYIYTYIYIVVYNKK